MSHFITELEIDENGDGVADLQTYFWDGVKPRACEEWRDGRWQSLSVAKCCCRAGCGGMKDYGCGAPSP